MARKRRKFKQVDANIYREGRSTYPITKYKKIQFKFGEHFSKHINGMFINPRVTIRRVIREEATSVDVFVPFMVVICAAIMTAIGVTMWEIAFTQSYLVAFMETLKFFGLFFGLPIWYVMLWLIWAGIFHFLGSLVSGKDITDKYIAHRTLKLIGFCTVPLFLNILPYFDFFTSYWKWMLCWWAMELNYGVTKRGSFIIALPMLFVTVLNTLFRLGLL